MQRRPEEVPCPEPCGAPLSREQAVEWRLGRTPQSQKLRAENSLRDSVLFLKPFRAHLAWRDGEIPLAAIHTGHQVRKFRLRHVPIPDPIDTALSRLGLSLCAGNE